VLYFPKLDHATVFDARADRAVLLEVLSQFVRQDWASGRVRGQLFTIMVLYVGCNARIYRVYDRTLSLCT
jgi:hypothetical protein